MTSSIRNPVISFGRTGRVLCVLVVALAWALASARLARAAGTFYVDNSTTACSKSASGTEANPYCTISSAVAQRGGPGTTILVKPGVYPEQVTIPVSGTSGSPFVIRALGAGVIVDGSDDFANPALWTPVSGAVYVASTVNWTPLQVLADGQRLTVSTAAPGALPSGGFRFVAGQGLYVNVGGNPGVHEVRVGRRLHGFLATDKDWITIEGFTVVRTEDRSIDIAGASSNVTVSNNRILHSNKYGIRVSGGRNVTVSGNTIAYSNDHGIYVSDGSRGCLIQDNESSFNARPDVRAAHGIHFGAASDNTLQRNRCHDNQDSGIQFSLGSNDNLSRQNVSWRNGDHGYDHLNSTGTRHINDIAYGNYKDGFSIEGNSKKTTLYNCIGVDNGLTTGEYDLWVDQESSTGFQSDYNIFWNSTSQAPIKYINTQYAALAAYQAATGKDAQSRQQNPLFLSAPDGDFHVQNGSPAVDNAHASVANWLATDADGRARVDVVSVANQGLGIPPFSDRGIYEFYPVVPGDRAPIVAAPQSVRSDESELVVVNVSVSDPEADPIHTLTANLSGLPAPNDAVFVTNATRTVGTLMWTPTTAHAGGSYNVTFTASNATSASATTAIAVGDRAPIVAAPAIVSGAEGGVLGFTVTATDPDGEPIHSLTATNLPPGATFTPNGTFTSGTFVWTPGYTVGPATYDVTFTAANARIGTSSTSVSVTNHDRAPVVTVPSAIAGSEAAVVTVVVTATDPDGEAVTSLSANLSGLPAGSNAVFTAAPDQASGTLSWTPTYTDGRPAAYLVTFTAANALAANATASVTVHDVDRAPTIAAPASVTKNERQQIELVTSASDPDGNPITVLTADLSALPVGHDATFAVNGSNTGGTLRWRPTYADAGPFPVTFSVANTLSSSTTTTLMIVNADRAPVVTATEFVDAVEAGVFSMHVSAADPDGETITSLTANLAMLPAGHNATFTPAPSQTEGTLTWTPTHQDGRGPTYDVVFTASNAKTGSRTASILVRNVDRPPVLSAPVVVRTNESDAVQVQVTATDPDGDALDLLSADLSTLPPGNNAVFVKAEPGFTTALASGEQSMPTSTSPPGALATSDSTKTAPSGIRARRHEVDPVEPPDEGSGAGGSTSSLTYVLVWTPTYGDAPGPYPVTFTATNALTANATSWIEIANQDLAPVVVAPPTASGGEGVLLSISVTASDADGDAINSLTADLSALPPGHDAAFVAEPDQQSGTLTWTPSAGDAASGPYIISFMAANALGDTALTSIDLASAVAGSDFGSGGEAGARADGFATSDTLARRAAATAEKRTAPPATAQSEMDRPAVRNGQIAVAMTPNPVRGNAQIGFVLPAPGPVQVDIFSVDGRRVANLAQEYHREPGAIQIPVSTRSFQPGLYFYRVVTRSGTSSGRFVTLKF